MLACDFKKLDSLHRGHSSTRYFLQLFLCQIMHTLYLDLIALIKTILPTEGRRSLRVREALITTLAYDVEEMPERTTPP